MKRRDFLTGLVSLYSVACGSTIYGVEAFDQEQKQVRNDFLRELGYEVEGVQLNGKVVMCRVVYDSLDETGLELDVQREYLRSQGLQSKEFRHVTTFSRFDPDTHVLCLEFPVTSEELERRSKEFINPEYEEERRKSLEKYEEERRKALKLHE